MALVVVLSQRCCSCVVGVGELVQAVQAVPAVRASICDASRRADLRCCDYISPTGPSL